MWESFVNLFVNMDPIVYILFIAGIILCFCEMLTPGFGIFGISGLICLAVGVILRMLDDGDTYMLVYMLLFFTILLVTMFIIFARSVKKGWLAKSSLMDVDVATVADGKASGTADFSHLIGLKGKTTTMLRPVGQVQFGDKFIDCVTQSSVFIDAGVEVRCVGVEGQRVLVKPLK